MKFVAISFDTSILNDLRHYSNLSELYTANPQDFLKQSKSDKSKYYINLVTQDFELRKKISQHLTFLNCNRFSVVHESSCVTASTVGDGSFIYPNVTLYPDSIIGQDVIVHSNSRISHNSVIGDGCFIGGLVNISGSVKIGKYNRIYPCCNIIDKICICDNVVIGTGSTIKKSIHESGTYSKLSDKIKKIN